MVIEWGQGFFAFLLEMQQTGEVVVVWYAPHSLLMAPSNLLPNRSPRSLSFASLCRLEAINCTNGDDGAAFHTWTIAA